MQSACAAGLAPAVVGVDSGAGILLTEYRAGARSWTAADARRPANIRRAAELLRALHALEVDAPVFNAERIAQSYLGALAAAEALGRPLGARARVWAAELLELARGYDASRPANALCHNDLVAANVLDDGDLALVDFEYAVRAAPLLDLASLAAMNDFGADERGELLAVYARAAPSIGAAQLEQTVRMVRLIAFFWARLAELRVAEPDRYGRLAVELGERLK
jgi:thiamine kinase-like enzyme